MADEFDSKEFYELCQSYRLEPLGSEECVKRFEAIKTFARRIESAVKAEMRGEPVDFDAWQRNPYTKVLQESIKNDYVPRCHAPIPEGMVLVPKGLQISTAIDLADAYREHVKQYGPVAADWRDYVWPKLYKAMIARADYATRRAVERAVLERELEAERKARETSLVERTAQLIAHRGCCGVEHDPQNGKLHGYCVVCGVPWPCAYAGSPPAAEARVRELEGVL